MLTLHLVKSILGQLKKNPPKIQFFKDEAFQRETNWKKSFIKLLIKCSALTYLACECQRWCRRAPRAQGRLQLDRHCKRGISSQGIKGCLRSYGDVGCRHGAHFSHFLGLLQGQLLVGGFLHLLLVLGHKSKRNPGINHGITTSRAPQGLGGGGCHWCAARAHEI